MNEVIKECIEHGIKPIGKLYNTQITFIMIRF